MIAEEAALRIPYDLPTAADFRKAMAERELRLEERNALPHVQALVASARSEAAAVASMLMSRFGATRVRLFGSLARGDVGEAFDIDIAVEGILPELFFRACAAADRLVTRKLDVVDVLDASPLLKQRIDEDGIDLK